MDTLFFIGYIFALSLLAMIVYRLKVLGFKSYFRGITEFVVKEKDLFSEINYFCLALSSLLAPIILFAYPKFIDRFPDDFETSENFLLHVIALIIYIAALLGCFHHLCYVLRNILKARNDQKKIK